MAAQGHRRPSPHATGRLAADVGGVVGDLRHDLRSSLDRAAALEAAGRVDLAAAVLEEQRAALADVHARLERRLAAAAVEAEAEAVVGASLDRPVALDATAPPRGDGAVLRLLASAAAAAMGVVLLWTPGPTGGSLGAAGDQLAGAADVERTAPDDRVRAGASTGVAPSDGGSAVASPGATRTPDPVTQRPTPAIVAASTTPTEQPTAGLVPEAVLDLLADVSGEQLDDVDAPADGADEPPAGEPDAPAREATPAGTDGTSTDEPAAERPHDDDATDAPASDGGTAAGSGHDDAAEGSPPPGSTATTPGVGGSAGDVGTAGADGPGTAPDSSVSAAER